MKKFLLICLISVVVGVCFYGAANYLLAEDFILAWDRAGIILGYFLACLSTGAAIIAFIMKDEIVQWFRGISLRRRFEGLGQQFDPMREKVEAIIIPVSRKEQPEWIMRHLRPKAVSFIYSSKTENEMNELKDTARNLGIDTLIPEGTPPGLIDPDDPAATRDAARRMIESFIQHGINRKGIFADTTGGKVPMSIGLFQAAEEAGVSSIYVTGKAKGGIIKDPSNAKHGKPIFISDHTEDPQ